MDTLINSGTAYQLQPTAGISNPPVSSAGSCVAFSTGAALPGWKLTKKHHACC